MLLKTRPVITSPISGRPKLASRLFWGGLVLSLSLHSIVLMLPWSIWFPASEPLDLLTLESEPVDGISVAVLPVTEPLQSVEAVTSANSLDSSVLAIDPVLPVPSAEPVWPELLSASLSEPLPQSETAASLPSQPDFLDESVESAPLPAEESLTIEALRPAKEEPTLESPKPDVVIDASPEHDVVVRLAADFPHLAGAQAGCYGLENCHRLEHGGNYRQAAQQLMAQMQAQGYQVSERDDIDAPGHRVFDVVPPEDAAVTYYLNVFSDGSQSAVYALTLTILSLNELQQLSL